MWSYLINKLLPYWVSKGYKQRMKRYNIVAIEISNEGKAPEFKNITVGGLDLVPQSQNEIARMALAAINDISGTKEVKFVTELSEEDFNKYFHNQLMDYINSKD